MENKRLICMNFVRDMFQLRDLIHIEHLLTDTNSKHEIFNELYDDLLEFNDEFAEVAMSRFGKFQTIKFLPRGFDRPIDIVSHLKQIRENIESFKQYIPDCGDLCSIIDNFETSISKCIYKLENFND
ncbi:MAG: DUF5856 family protein [Thomasclavelia ramosa]|nr:DUF5856 family protein [Thomasclavelia ramosa]